MTDRAVISNTPWWLGSTKAKKVIHQAHCPHAALPYKWAADYPSVGALADALVASGAWRWHRCCQKCNGILDDAIAARLRAVRAPLTADEFLRLLDGTDPNGSPVLDDGSWDASAAEGAPRD